jgi:hypothetical protein
MKFPPTNYFSLFFSLKVAIFPKTLRERNSSIVSATKRSRITHPLGKKSNEDYLAVPTNQFILTIALSKYT